MTARKKTRQRRGEGSLFFDRTRGRWIAQLPGGQDPDTGRRKRGPKGSAPTEAEARELLKKMARDLEDTGVAARRDITVGDVVRDLLANPPASWKSPTTLQVNRDLAAWIIKGIGGVKLVKLTPGDVEKRVLGAMVRAGLATATISATKGIGKKAVKRAQRDGMVGRNVFELAETPRGTRTKSKAMTMEQIGKLLGSGLTPWWRAYCTVGILCGLRPGELLGLSWDDVDFDAGVIRIRHSLKAVKGSDGRTVLRLESLKTDRSRRTLQLPRKGAEALRALKVAQAADKLRLGRFYEDKGGICADCGAHALVFPNNAGQPRWRSSVNHSFKIQCKHAKIGSDWHLHEQRHTFVSVLSDSGVDIDDIADAAGHINANVTRVVYRHQIADKISKAAVAMDQVFGEAAGS